MKNSTTKHIYIKMSQIITFKVTCWLDWTLRPSHKWSLPFKRHSCCPPVSGGEARPSIVCVLCLTRWLLGMSHLTGSDCQQEQNVIMSGGCCGPATIIGNSSPQVMMIMDFAANDFGWAVFLAIGAGSDWNFFLCTSETGKKALSVPAGPWDALRLRNQHCVNTLCLCWTWLLVCYSRCLQVSQKHFD